MARPTLPEKSKSLESWIWAAASSIRGARRAPNGAERHRLPARAARRVSAAARIKYKDYILPLIFTKRLCDVFDDELNRIAKEVGSRKSRSDSGDNAAAGSGRRNAFQLVKGDPSRAERDRLPQAARRVNVGAFINNFIPDAGLPEPEIQIDGGSFVLTIRRQASEAPSGTRSGPSRDQVGAKWAPSLNSSQVPESECYWRPHGDRRTNKPH